MEAGAPNLQDGPKVPPVYIKCTPVQDDLQTSSSTIQNSTVEECLPYLTGDGTRGLFDFDVHGLPSLDRLKHIEFLHDCLGDLPSAFVAYDAARPWVLYWSLVGLSLLGEDVHQYRSRVVQTLSPMQNIDGGFGSGHGQMSHAAPSYAAVLSLAMVGGEEALGLVNRRTLWRWLGDLKQEDGGFRVCIGGEEDVRGAYCSMTIISLLRLPHDLPPTAPARAAGHTSFMSGLPEYISRCQTFEGGMSGTPQTEAHGAYAFCALACLSMLGPPKKIIPEYLDIQILLSWLSARQYAPEGGFAGRTNKLVDGCYSHWVGGCWPLLEAALNGPRQFGPDMSPATGSLYSREGLNRYPDGYHSCYVLAGLSSAQHYNYLTAQGSEETIVSKDSTMGWNASETVPQSLDAQQESTFKLDDRVSPIHPIYVIPYGAAEDTYAWFAKQTSF